ncbi:putative autotransporter adhesin-like protein [Flavobacterium endophyticum]|uniref:Putative autotransporter adhesin-like protein n=1 Tax=Flavobacterium endophyticum TaxID=1540163 RepID=A0A495MMB6_9FLAO|nr:head GIN domain-containing protein [Flavobacterium endophyticum]RKS25529.1 putative autotransporter adhesin-like protein [Flavobacterium endophyticum]
MIRIIIYFMKLIVALLVSLFFTSCQFTTGKSVTGSGNITTETRNVGEFKGISVNNALEVELEQSDSFGVTVEADDNLQQYITTRVENGILIIETDVNNFKNVEAKRIKVKMPIISSLEASSASSIKSVNTLKTEKLLADASSAAEINIDVEADDLICNSSSASSVNVKGKALKFKTESSSGSDIEAQGLLANDITAEASSGSTISLHPILTLNADASSGGSITYNTVPRDNLTQKADSGGSISKN